MTTDWQSQDKNPELIVCSQLYIPTPETEVHGLFIGPYDYSLLFIYYTHELICSLSGLQRYLALF